MVHVPSMEVLRWSHLWRFWDGAIYGGVEVVPSMEVLGWCIGLKWLRTVVGCVSMRTA